MKYALLLFIRSLKRQKLFSAINLLGLTVSMVSTIIIYLYVSHELSFDRFHTHADRIYRINQTFIWGERNDNQFASTGPGVAHAIKEELPEVELITSIYTPGNFLVAYTNPKNEVIAFEQERVLAADSNFFALFNFPLLSGAKETALIQPNTLVMTEATAQKYFTNEDPIGKLVRVGVGEAQRTYEVTGVVKNLPENSYIQFDMLLSMESFPAIERMRWSWIWTQLETYVRVQENTDIEQTRAKLAAIPRKHAEQTLQRVMNISFDEYIKSGKTWELFIQPLTGIHLPSSVVYDRINNTAGNIKIIYSLIGAAIFIVLLSCINFMNLSTAQFTRRIKEASIRKILGLGRKELSYNYLIEAFIFSSFAMVLSLGIVQIALPVFNKISGKGLQFNLMSDPYLALTLGGLILLMSLVSGSYPALFLSGFHPIEAIKGKLKTGREGRAFRNGLVVFQFSLSILLILCTSVVFQQLRFFSEKDLGFDKENLVVVKHAERTLNSETLKNAVVSVPGVISSSVCTSVPPNLYGGDKFAAEGMSNSSFPLNFTTGDESFVPTMGIKVKYGRNFSLENPGDVNRVLLNEVALKRIGWDADESVVGKRIEIPGTDVRFEVAGIVEDFNYWSLQAPIEPMAIFHIKNTTIQGAGQKQYVLLKIAAQNSAAWSKTLAGLEQVWKQQAADFPLQYEFVDESFASTFKTQQQFGQALTIMAALAILIACLGLLGMIVYSLEQRTKEIGIRKVSGATAFNILVLISKGYTKLIIIAFVISAPAAYWLMQQWLSDFAFRITPSPILFVGVGLSTLAISILITSYHSVKASLQNPVNILRDE